LVGNPRADLRLARAGGEVTQRLRHGNLLRVALYDHLPLHLDPREKQAYGRVRGDVGGFARFIVREKSEALPVEGLKQDRALRGEAVRRDRGQRHRVRLVEMEIGCLPEPFLENLRRVIAQILSPQTMGGVFFSEIGEIHTHLHRP